MGQRDVLQVLKKHPKKWFTAKQIASILTNVDYGSITMSLSKLRLQNAISWKRAGIQIGSGAIPYYYQHKPIYKRKK
jgi:hypothetical protein